METDLDEVEEGQREMLALLTEFYGPFKTDVEKAHVEMKDLKKVRNSDGTFTKKCESHGWGGGWGRNSGVSRKGSNP